MRKLWRRFMALFAASSIQGDNSEDDLVGICHKCKQAVFKDDVYYYVYYYYNHSDLYHTVCPEVS